MSVCFEKLLYALISARGEIHLEFTTPEEADCVLYGWKADFCWATRPLGELVTKHQLWRIFFQVSESDILSKAMGNHCKLSNCRFPQKPSLTRQQPTGFHWTFVLSTSRIHTIWNTNNRLLLMSEVRICQVHLPFETFMQTLLWRAFCRQLPMESARQVPAKCSGNHETDSFDWPTYIKQQQIVYEARDLQASTSRNPASKMIAYPSFNFLQKIIYCWVIIVKQQNSFSTTN